VDGVPTLGLLDGVEVDEGLRNNLTPRRLDKALQKFNEALAQNKTLRGYIDSLHKERVVFDGIYKKLEYDLHKKKKEMAAIIEDSKNAQRRADRSQRSLDKLKQGMEDEKKAFEKEWADLGALMEQDRQLQEALRRKEREEHERKTAEALAASKKAEEEPYMSEDPEESEEEEEESPGKKKKVEEDRPKLTEEEVQEYQATFERITKATGIQTVEELVDTFQDIEQKNFSLFNSINELTTVHKSKMAVWSRRSIRPAWQRSCTRLTG
jgi:DNA repair exonuclease SbcCD ATPase subunit